MDECKFHIKVNFYDNNYFLRMNKMNEFRIKVNRNEQNEQYVFVQFSLKLEQKYAILLKFNWVILQKTQKSLKWNSNRLYHVLINRENNNCMSEKKMFDELTIAITDGLDTVKSHNKLHFCLIIKKASSIGFSVDYIVLMVSISSNSIQLFNCNGELFCAFGIFLCLTFCQEFPSERYLWLLFFVLLSITWNVWQRLCKLFSLQIIIQRLILNRI